MAWLNVLKLMSRTTELESVVGTICRTVEMLENVFLEDKMALNNLAKLLSHLKNVLNLMKALNFLGKVFST